MRILGVSDFNTLNIPQQIQFNRQEHSLLMEALTCIWIGAVLCLRLCWNMYPSCWNIQTQTLEINFLCYYPVNINRRMMSVLQNVSLYILRIAPAVAMKLLVHHDCESLQFGVSVIELVMCSNILSFCSLINVKSVQGKMEVTGKRFFSGFDFLDIGLVFPTAKNFFSICVKKVVILF